jgi:ubiquinol-cytochrome c reductase cytochrome b subunit
VPDAQLDKVAEASGRRTRLWRWLDRRTGANALLHASLDEPIPGGARFAYVFGSALLFLFVSQLITGVCLAVYYVPSPLTAHVTLAYIIKDVAGGAFLRSLHSYGSSAMVVVLVLHFLQTFLYGSYKGKRELLWISGCVLSLLILGMTFTGFLLRWDLRAYFAGSVGTNIAGDVPLVGSWLLRLVRGGEMMGALTLSRFYVLHVFLIPGAIFTFVAVHIFLFRKAGPAGPMREDPVQPRLRTETFYPRQVIIDMAFVLIVMGVVGMLAHFVPATLGPVADPSNSNYQPRPEWYYLPFFQWLKFWEGPKTVIGVVLIPAILIILVFLLPFMDRGQERRPWKRPIPVGSVLIVLIGMIGLGMQSRLDDSSDPTTASQIARQDAEEAQFLHAPFEPYSVALLADAAAPAALSGTVEHGQSLFQSHSCSSCHGAGGAGGGVGPALTHISDKLPPVQLTALLKAPNAAMKAGGMTPLTLNAADMAALVSYLSSLGTTSPVSATAAAPSETSSARTAALPLPASTASAAALGDKTAQPIHGGILYQSDGCAACHGEGGKGTQRAPALVDVGSKFSSLQLTQLLHTPTAAMTAGGMPRVSGTTAEIASLVAYIRSLKSTGAAQGQAVASKVVAPPAPERQAAAPRSSAPPATPQPAAAQPAAATPPDSAGLAAVGQPTNSQAQRGEAFFAARGCTVCHGIGGVGTKTAPALAAFSKTLTPAALTSLLQHPNNKMQAGGMPATNMGAADMSALVAYLQHLGSPGAAPATGASAPGQSAANVSPTGASQGGIGALQRPMNLLEVRGESVFRAHSCATCHGMSGVQGTWAAPALANTGKNYPPALLITLLLHPTARMQQGGMPPVGISGDELDALVAYVAFISATKAAPPPTPR